MKRNIVFAVFSICAVLAAGGSVVNGQDGAGRLRRVAVSTDSSTEMRIFELVNRQRLRDSLPALGWNDEIAGVARAYSQRMASEDFFDHYDPEGRTAIDRASKVHGWRFIGENLFMTEEVSDLPAFAIHGWMGSATHRTNMLDPQWTTTGIGIGRAANGDIYITELFTRK
jgi:uncharacterized protein YkwD